jgi:hypothetical protein
MPDLSVEATTGRFFTALKIPVENKKWVLIREIDGSNFSLGRCNSRDLEYRQMRRTGFNSFVRWLGSWSRPVETNRRLALSEVRSENR